MTFSQMTFSLSADERAVLGLRFDGSRLRIRCAISETLAGAAHVVAGFLVLGWAFTRGTGLIAVSAGVASVVVMGLGLASARPKLVLDCSERTIRITNRFRRFQISLDDVLDVSVTHARFAFGRWPSSSFFNGPKEFVIGQIRTTAGDELRVDAVCSPQKGPGSHTWAELKGDALARLVAELTN